MRIAVDGRFLTDHYPGIGRYLFNLLPALARLASPDPVSVLVDARSANTRFDLDALREQGLRLAATEVPARRAGEQLVLPRWARRVAAEVLHVPFWWTAHRLPCPLVVTLYDTIPLDVPSTLDPLRLLLYRIAVRSTAHRAGCVLTLSRAARTRLERRLSIPGARIGITPPAADPRFRPAPPEATEELRRRLGLPASYVLTLAGPRKHKNLQRLLRGWQALATPPGAPVLVLAGLEQPEVLPGIELPPRVRQLGPVGEAELPVLLSGARLLVAPSLVEGFGLPVLEAMACATPVACSSIPAFIEVAADAALFFDPLEPAAIAAAMGELLANDDLHGRLAHAGLRRARSFSWEETARQTLAGYRRALEGSSVRRHPNR